MKNRCLKERDIRIFVLIGLDNDGDWMRQVKRQIACLSILCLFMTGMGGCAGIVTTRPNTPLQGPHPEAIEKIQQANPLLARELLKLPEIQDGISPEEAASLAEIARIYSDCPEDFEAAFKQMYQVGLPHVRRYCAPLQALFWLFEDGQLNEEECEFISNYNLRMLLQLSWDYEQDHRWKDFDQVKERLNAPELIDYYERSRIRYNYASGHGEDLSEVGYVFVYSKGHCAQITAFTVYLLRMGGYQASKRIIPDLRYASPRGNHHRVCVFVANGKKYVMDNGRPRPFGIIPYDQYDINRHPYTLGKAFDNVWDEFQSD